MFVFSFDNCSIFFFDWFISGFVHFAICFLSKFVILPILLSVAAVPVTAWLTSLICFMGALECLPIAACHIS